VDDMLIMSENKEDLENIKRKIKSTLEITESDKIVRFLNIYLNRKTDGTWEIHQSKYIEEILSRFNMTGCNPVKTPLAQGEKLHLENEKTGKLDVPYKQAIGMIQYLASSTRPDIAFAASYLGQLSSNPNRKHWAAAKHVMRYLEGTKNKRLIIDDGNEEIRAYTDADWAGSTSEFKSYSGFVIFMGKMPIVWRTRKQNCISLSTQEAEYVAMSECSKELQWLNNLLEELDLKSNNKPVLFCDNTSAIRLAENPMMTGKSKHIAIRYHFVRDLVIGNKIMIKHIPSEENVADILTKPLGTVKNGYFRGKLDLSG
jgi:hypothetical protein